MYREFYGFSEEPFALSPDPKFLFPARSHFEALSSMMSAIKERKGIVVVTGEVGLGKTLLIYALLNDLSDKIKTAFIFNPGLDLKSLFKNILQDLDVPFGRRQDDLLSLMTRFREYL
ncbi:MAG: AAA family ATPase, partial [Deltaproteobacteria bacterium]|nr:AAA family ATPase [Deltaproteobacteria bacterium]